MKNYAGKLFSILGDSISTLEGWNPPENAVFYDRYNKLEAEIYAPADTWWGMVIETVGGQLLVNDAWSGSTVFKDPRYEIESYGCSDKRTSSLGKEGKTPDVIMVYLGTNDWGYPVKIASERKEDGKNPLYFESAYRLMLDKLKRNYPKAEIWCITPTVSKCAGDSEFRFNTRLRGAEMKLYCDAVERCAREYDCRFIDIFTDAEPYDTIDRFHATREGMKTIAREILFRIGYGREE